MKILITIAISLASLFSCQCTSSKGVFSPSGTIVKEARPITQFEELVIKGPVDVFLKQGKNTHLEVEADDNIVKRITTEVKNNTLYIGLKTLSNYMSITSKQGIKVFVTTPQVTNIRISGSGNFTGDELWDFQNMDIYINGSGDVTMSLNGQKLTVSLQGSGDLNVDGTVIHQEIDISGSGDYNARILQSETASVRINGSGDVTLNVKDQLDVQVSGSGDVRYQGNPQVKSRISGSGHIQTLSK